MEELGLEEKETSPYMVCLGDGQKNRTQGCCVGVPLTLEGAKIKEKFYLFELEGVDIILGDIVDDFGRD